MNILNVLAEVTVYSAIIFAVTMLVKKTLGSRMSAFLHYTVWLVLVLRLAMPFTIDSPLRLFVLPAESTAVSETQDAPVTYNNFEDAGTYSEADTSTDADTSFSQPSANHNTGDTQPVPAQTKEPSHITWQQAVVALWLAGTGLCIAYIAAVYIGLNRKIKKKGVEPSTRLKELFEQTKVQMGIKAKLRLVCLYEYGTPALMFPGTVLMPMDSLAVMDEEQTRYALRHELMHYKRADHIISMLLSLLNAVYWFNPFVWLAFRQMRKDMETACDGRVVKNLGKEQKSNYAALIVRLFAQPVHRQIVLGMAQVDARKTAEHRVRGIFMKEKSKNSAKLVCVVLAATILVTCFTTACQPTPESPAVVNKNEGVMESAIAASPEPTDKKYEAPETLVLEEFDVNAKLTASIDAQVEIPDTNAYPVYEFVKGTYAQEQVDKIIEYFYGDKTLYNAAQPLTKDVFEERLVDAKRVYQEILNGATNEAGNVKYENSSEEMLEVIESLEQAILTAPETNEVQVSDGTLKPSTISLYNMETLYVTPDISQKDSMSFIVRNSIDSDGASYLRLINGYRYYPIGDSVNKQVDGITTTPQEAKQTVQDMLDSFGCNFMEAAVVEAGQVIESEEVVRDDLTGGYRVTCLRRAGDFLVTTMSDGSDYLNEQNMTDEELNEMYSHMWPPEELYVYVDDTGVTAIDWQGYGEIASTVSENVKLLPFERLSDLFKNAISAQYSWMSEEEERRYSITVDRIVLSMARIQVKDNPENWQLVPVWEFYGTYTYYNQNGTEEIVGNYGRSLLIINAIDGSMVL